MEIHVDVHALKIYSNAMADIPSEMPTPLTNIVVNLGCLTTNHKVANQL